MDSEKVSAEELARKDFAVYIQYMNPKFIIPEFHVTMADALMSDDGCLISLPPDHAKSTIASILFLTWSIGNNPSANSILAVGSPKLKSAFAMQIRRVMESTKYKNVFPQVLIRKDSDGKLMFHTLDGGQTIIVSKGEAISGIRASLIIFDDLVGGAKEAQSQVERENAWNYLNMDLLSREDKTYKVKIVGVGTRWHKEDVLCRIEKEAGFESLKVIKFKAINENGEALWPERHDIDDLNVKKLRMGSKSFLALYQQEPTDEEGSIIKRGWIKHFREKPARFDEIIQSWDAAFGKSDSSDYVVGVVIGRVGAEFYLLDMVRARMDFPETKKAIKSMSAKWPSTFRKVVEKKANGAALIDDLAKEVMGLVPYVPKESKESRASSVSALFEAGNVYFPDPSVAPWIHDTIEEVVNFPNHGHDDMLDAIVQALLHLRENANWISGMIKR